MKGETGKASGLVELVLWLYAILLKLNPAGFQEQFADEMKEVFGEAAARAAQGDASLPAHAP